MAKITPCLWFDGQAEEAANFYVTLLPDSRVDKVWRSPAERSAPTNWCSSSPASAATSRRGTT